MGVGDSIWSHSVDTYNSVFMRDLSICLSVYPSICLSKSVDWLKVQLDISVDVSARSKYQSLADKHFLFIQNFRYVNWQTKGK